jgi:hypothetical protein
MIELIGNLDVGQHLRRIWLDVTTDFGLHRFTQNGRFFFPAPALLLQAQAAIAATSSLSQSNGHGGLQ